MDYSKADYVHLILTIILMSGLMGLAMAIFKMFSLFPNFIDVAWLVVSALYFGWRSKLLTGLIWVVWLICIIFNAVRFLFF